jgi:non-homologous end joining protein Ku
VVDLMERLRRSLDQAGAKSKPAKPRAVNKKKRAA